MKNTLPSTSLCNSRNKSLSGWGGAILEAKRQIKGLKVSIRIFQDMRDRGAPFPEPTSGSAEEVMGQEGVLGQSPGGRGGDGERGHGVTGGTALDKNSNQS